MHVPRRSNDLRARTLVAVLALIVGCATLAPSAPAAAAPSFLDVRVTNGEGESAGGIAAALPDTRAELEPLLATARRSGASPQRYATLLHQYWLVRGADRAGIDLAKWDPALGLGPNRGNVDKVYINYLGLARERPELYWAGMAGIAGVSFAAGFYDLDDVASIMSVPGVGTLATAIGGVVNAVGPQQVLSALPADVRLLVTRGPGLTDADLRWYIQRLLIMQKHIFIDMVPMHEAYLDGGAEAIGEYARAGLMDDNMRRAWDSVAANTPARLTDALVRMASREQNQIVADQWDVTSAGRGVMGRVMSYVTTLAGKPAVPDTPAPGNYAPIDVRIEPGPVRVRAPLPAFNWADRAPRWKFIADELAPKYAAAIQRHPAETRALLATPFPELAARGRLMQRVPVVLADLTTGWWVGPA
ncbi:hypothetical protein [Tsukamurella pseudospumae]|uniref:hypothetical protein n=1 Tax=Tsukamurella pseudospumae TaxID=239498 RepID=UPI00083C9182|nr:hypothetical protein [Tsukamurella pseudospumae]